MPLFAVSAHRQRWVSLYLYMIVREQAQQREGERVSKGKRSCLFERHPQNVLHVFSSTPEGNLYQLTPLKRASSNQQNIFLVFSLFYYVSLYLV